MYDHPTSHETRTNCTGLTTPKFEKTESPLKSHERPTMNNTIHERLRNRLNLDFVENVPIIIT